VPVAPVRLGGVGGGVSFSRLVIVAPSAVAFHSGNWNVHGESFALRSATSFCTSSAGFSPAGRFSAGPAALAS
jgi:hypothetical protein